MAWADGKLEDVERAAIFHEMAGFGVSDEDAKNLANEGDGMEFGEAITVLSKMTDEQKRYASGFLAAIMVCDQNIDDAEVNLWQMICTFGNFPVMTLDEALNFWTKH